MLNVFFSLHLGVEHGAGFFIMIIDVIEWQFYSLISIFLETRFFIFSRNCFFNKTTDVGRLIVQ